MVKDSTVLLLAHRACFDENDNRHYFPIAILHDVKRGSFKYLGILTSSNDFPVGPSKRDDFTHVVSPSSIVMRGDKADLWVGLRDTQIGKITIDNPLLKSDIHSSGENHQEVFALT